MYQTHLFGGTLREAPRDEVSPNAILLTRGGYIYKSMAGVYNYLPLGLRVLEKLKQIVREEMNNLPRTQEVLMPVLQSRELWEETGRWETAQDVMYTLDENKLALGPTHEEVATDLFRHYATSYRDLPAAIFQIQTKFRNEPRAKSGLLRGREFLMKDLYSYHLSEADLDRYYNEVIEAYRRVYKRAGIPAILTRALGGMFTKYSEEFQAVSAAGEDTIYLNKTRDYAWNKEVIEDESDPELKAFSEGELRKVAAVEVGNIFKCKTRYTEPMHASVLDEKGESVDVWMGCYGLGISRLMGVLVEMYGDVVSSSIKWPQSVAPFAVHLVDLTPDLSGEIVYKGLLSQDVDVLYDNREASPGEKFADADLIGAPIRVIYSKRSLDQGGAEVRFAATGATEIIPLDQLGQRLKS